ncbi:MAG: hypothetical protein KJO69_06895, partial [Gammaproteobacteria bacterium]|nr:hypothetical protein [Gammaproteobacteria bacterium]
MTIIKQETNKPVSHIKSQKTRQFYTFLHKQVLVLLGLSLGPGIGYIILAMINGVMGRAVAWYVLMIMASAWGYRLYRQF